MTSAASPESFDVLASGPDADGWRLHLRIPAGTPLCDGHFPGHPIVPGVAHLAWVERALADRGGRPVAIRGVRGFRLRKPVHPGDELELTVKPVEEGSFAFHLKRNGEAVSDGRVEMAGAGPGAGSGAASGIDGRTDKEAGAGTGAPGEAGQELQLREGSAPSYPPAESLIPHRGPLRLLRRVLDLGPGTLLGEVEVLPDNPFVSGGHAPGWLALEAAAQAAAALEALSRRQTDPGPRQGYLVGVREARIVRPMLFAGAPFRVTLQVQGSAPPLAIYEAIADLGGLPVLRGTLSTYVPPG